MSAKEYCYGKKKYGGFPIQFPYIALSIKTYDIFYYISPPKQHLNETFMNKNSYNKIALEWSKIRSRSFVSKLVIDFADRINTKGTVLDIGCGSGYLSKYLSERGFQVTGIDISEKMIEIANSQNIPDTNFLISDFFDFLSPVKFDGVIAWDSFFHFPKEQQEIIYYKVESLLRTGGYLLFTHGNADDEHVDEMMAEPFYYSCLPKDRVCKILSRLGLEIEYIHEGFTEKDTHRDLVVLARK